VSSGTVADSSSARRGGRRAVGGGVEPEREGGEAIKAFLKEKKSEKICEDCHTLAYKDELFFRRAQSA
jgi:hypothetical protein